MAGKQDNRIYVKVSEFREKLRGYVDEIRELNREVIVQSSKKNVIVAMSYERYLELKQKAGESTEEEPKPNKARKRLHLNNEPLTCETALVVAT